MIFASAFPCAGENSENEKPSDFFDSSICVRMPPENHFSGWVGGKSKFYLTPVGGFRACGCTWHNMLNMVHELSGRNICCEKGLFWCLLLAFGVFLFTHHITIMSSALNWIYCVGVFPFSDIFSSWSLISLSLRYEFAWEKQKQKCDPCGRWKRPPPRPDPIPRSNWRNAAVDALKSIPWIPLILIRELISLHDFIMNVSYS